MPRIGKHTFVKRGKWIDFIINYTRSGGFHFKEDCEFLSKYGFVNNQSTEHYLLEKFSEAMKKYHDAVSSSEKLIHITVAVGRESAWTRIKDGGWQGKGGKWNSAMNMDSTSGLGISFEVIWKVSAKEVKYYQDKDGDIGWEYRGYSTMRPEGFLVPYSEQKKGMLEGVQSKLNGMAEEFIDFFLKPDLAMRLESPSTKLLD